MRGAPPVQRVRRKIRELVGGKSLTADGQERSRASSCATNLRSSRSSAVFYLICFQLYECEPRSFVPLHARDEDRGASCGNSQAPPLLHSWRKGSSLGWALPCSLGVRSFNAPARSFLVLPSTWPCGRDPCCPPSLQV